jgi:hypothetical protein
MVYELKKLDPATSVEVVIEARRQEIYDMWSSKMMCDEEMKRLERFITEYLQDGEQIDATADDILSDMREVFIKYNLRNDVISTAVLVYLFEFLKY